MYGRCFASPLFTVVLDAVALVRRGNCFLTGQELSQTIKKDYKNILLKAFPGILF